MINAEIQVRDSFLAALMLTGTNAAAEQAVSAAIATLGCGVAVDELLIATAKCAIQIPDGCLPGPEIASSLPAELQRLFLLSSVGRKCFVLRSLTYIDGTHPGSDFWNSKSAKRGSR